jgi:hypothetical protein
VSATWTDLDRLEKQDLEHDVAYAIVNGFEPRPEDLAALDALYGKRDAYLASTK